MRIRGEMKETLLEAVRMELLSRMIDMLPLSMYRRRCRRCVQHSFASPRLASPFLASSRLASPAWAHTRAHAHSMKAHTYMHDPHKPASLTAIEPRFASALAQWACDCARVSLRNPETNIRVFYRAGLQQLRQLRPLFYGLCSCQGFLRRGDGRQGMSPMRRSRSDRALARTASGAP